MRRILFLLLASHVAIALAYADSGQSGLAFLKLGVGARAIGMGEAYSAVASDPTSMYYNPAAIGQISGPQLLIMHKSWIEDVRTEYMGGAVRWGWLALGLNLNATSVNDIPVRSVPGDPITSFDQRNAALGVTAAIRFDSSLSIGGTVKYLYEEYLVDNSSGTGLDLSADYRTPWGIRLALGYFNIGAMSVLHTQSSILPHLVRGGAAYDIPVESLESRLTLAADVLSYTEDKLTHLHTGAEFDYHDTFAARLGFQTGYEGKNISAGIGIHYGLLHVDYAYVPFSYDLGSTHTLSLGIDFED